MLLKRAGVKIVFQISGDMVQFNLQLLFIQAVTSLGLLSVSTLIVELIMLYIMPLRKVYKKAKYEVRVCRRVCASVRAGTVAPFLFFSFSFFPPHLRKHPQTDPCSSL